LLIPGLQKGVLLQLDNASSAMSEEQGLSGTHVGRHQTPL